MELIVEKALEFAVAAHKGQVRKYTGEPYINHPIEVMNIVSRTPECYPAMLCAALLHDTVEDTEVLLDDIKREFGDWVSELVENLTDVSVPEDGNRAQRKEIDRQHIELAHYEAKTIKLADLISNSKSICEHDKDFAKVYIKEKELLLEVLKEGDETLWNQANHIVQKAKIELGIK